MAHIVSHLSVAHEAADVTFGDLSRQLGVVMPTYLDMLRDYREISCDVHDIERSFSPALRPSFQDGLHIHALTQTSYRNFEDVQSFENDIAERIQAVLPFLGSTAVQVCARTGVELSIDAQLLSMSTEMLHMVQDLRSNIISRTTAFSDQSELFDVAVSQTDAGMIRRYGAPSRLATMVEQRFLRSYRQHSNEDITIDVLEKVFAEKLEPGNEEQVRKLSQRVMEYMIEHVEQQYIPGQTKAPAAAAADV